MCVCVLRGEGREKGRWDFPGGPAIKILGFHFRGYGLDPWSGI